MHEMAIAVELLRLAKEEVAKATLGASNEAPRLVAVSARHGQISGVMPQCLELAFEALVAGTPDAGARLILEMEPLKLRCNQCQTIFGGESANDIWLKPCPKCGAEFGHEVVAGKELILVGVEVE